MSRRCDREKVAWELVPRDYWKWTRHPSHNIEWDAHPDPLERRAEHRRDLNQPDHGHCAHLCTHGWVMDQLRERTPLP